MSRRTKYGVEGASDAEHNAQWLIDTLNDLLDKCKALVGEHLVRLNK